MRFGFSILFNESAPFVFEISILEGQHQTILITELGMFSRLNDEILGTIVSTDASNAEQTVFDCVVSFCEIYSSTSLHEKGNHE